MILRDLRGHFARVDDAGRPCPHPCCNGSRPHPRGRPLVLSKRLQRKLDREASADTARLAAKRTPSSRRAALARTRAADREALRLAMHAQTLRAESYGLGYKAETAGFYGSDKHAQADTTERRLRLADADREAAARAAADREEAAAYRATRRTAEPTAEPDADWYEAWA